MPVGRKFSPELKKVAVARLELGESATALAAELGVHRTMPYKWRWAQQAGRLDRERKPAALTASGRLTTQAAVGKALQALADIMANSGSEASRIAAANAVLTRAQAKPGRAVKAAETGLTRIERVIIDPRDRSRD